jgi:hypothetical protein
MTFQEAKTALAALAGNEAYDLIYELMTYNIYPDQRDQRATCGVYINGQKWHEGSTWSEALKSISDAMGKSGVDANEAPGDEAGK